MALAIEPDIRKDFGEVLASATALTGSQEAAMRWLGTPVRALNYATPISALSKPEGKEAILAVLHRVEYGVF
jgi:putative toxin-antitoxin system antitoxin component (TIGR02293 family)